jgi:hypothetical protein
VITAHVELIVGGLVSDADHTVRALSKHDGLSGVVKPNYRCATPQSIRQGNNRGRDGSILVSWGLLRQ